MHQEELQWCDCVAIEQTFKSASSISTSLPGRNLHTAPLLPIRGETAARLLTSRRRAGTFMREERSPSQEAMRFLGATAKSLQSRMAIPCHSLGMGGATAMGARAGRNGTIVCPSVAAHLYPSPVVPVFGYDTPPVARIRWVVGSAEPPTRTPAIAFPSARSPSTRAPSRTSTPARFRIELNAPMTALADPEIGKTLPLGRATVVTPSFPERSSVIV
jgi:hypothetical protein